MKLREISPKTDAELAVLINSLRSDLAKAVIDSRTKEVKDTKQIGRLKQAIARATTIAHEREIAKTEAAQ
jgi:ribosomal protein L29